MIMIRESCCFVELLLKCQVSKTVLLARMSYHVSKAMKISKFDFDAGYAQSLSSGKTFSLTQSLCSSG